MSLLIYGPISTLIHRCVSTKRPQGILLTFDDGPDPRYTPKLLDLLDEYQVKALFFALSRKVLRYPELARDIEARGHQLALHGAYHLNAWRASPKQVKQNISLGIRQFRRMGFNPMLFRPPFGRVNLFHESPLPVLYWTKLFYDWNSQSKDHLVHAMKKRSAPGEIFLLHDGTEARAVEGMPLVMIEALREWLFWAHSVGIYISDGGRWPNE